MGERARPRRIVLLLAFTGGCTVSTPAIGDGRNEVAASTRDGYLFVWRTPGRPAASEAWAWHQDGWHTGRFGTDARPPSPPQRLRADAGRVCGTAPGGDWMDGRAARYELRAFASRPTPGGVMRGRGVDAPPHPAPARTRQCAPVPPAAPFALRAVDMSGLVSLPAIVATFGAPRR
jgi:hypothetical protein